MALVELERQRQNYAAVRARLFNTAPVEPVAASLTVREVERWRPLFDYCPPRNALGVVRLADEDQIEIGSEPSSDRPADFKPSVHAITRAVCRHYSMTKIGLLSQRRAREVVRPRQVAMYLATQLTGSSLTTLGRCFGGRDHTTLIHATRRIEQLLLTDKQMVADIAAITAALEAG
jgi:hypothetical protein